VGFASMDSSNVDLVALEIKKAILEGRTLEGHDCKSIKNDLVMQFGKDIEEIEESVLLQAIKDHVSSQHADSNFDLEALTLGNDDDNSFYFVGGSSQEPNQTNDISDSRFASAFQQQIAMTNNNNSSPPLPLSSSQQQISFAPPGLAPLHSQSQSQSLFQQRFSNSQSPLPTLQYSQSQMSLSPGYQQSRLPSQPVPPHLQQPASPTVITNEQELLTAFWEISFKIFYNICSENCLTRDCLSLVAGKRIPMF
jgi:hypothetical protein